MADTNNSGGIWGAIAGAAAHTATGVLGMIGQRKREQRAVKNTEHLMDVQQRNQIQLDKYGQEIQLNTWKKTNYPAQVEMLKEAGLNPGLLYGNGGPGGITGSQGGGAAASGNAPAPQYMPLDLGNAVKAAAEIKLLDAQTKKLEAETNVVNTTGVPEAQTRIQEASYRMENIKAVTENEKAKNALINAQNEYQKIQNNIANNTSEELIKQVQLNNEKLANDVRTGLAQAKVSESTVNEAITQIQRANVEQSLRIALAKENINKTKEETEKLIREITVMTTSVLQKWTSLSQTQQQLEINKIATEFNTSLPAKIGQWTGIIGNILKGSASISTSNVEVSK